MQDATTAPNPTRGRRGRGGVVVVEGRGWEGTQPDCKAGMIRRPVPFAIICAARIDTNDLVRYIIDLLPRVGVCVRLCQATWVPFSAPHALGWMGTWKRPGKH